MKDFLINKTFKQVEEYVEMLEKFALIGMMGNIGSHGFNENLHHLYTKIDRLPKEHDDIKILFHKTIGLVKSTLDSMYYSESMIRRDIKCADIVNFIKTFNNPNIKIEIDIKDEKYTYYGYPSIFYSILSELINNAIKYGEGKIKVTIGNDNNTYLIIESGGNVIKEKDKIFDYGYTTNKRNGSSGYGLYIIKKLLNNQSEDIKYFDYDDKDREYKNKFRLFKLNKHIL